MNLFSLVWNYLKAKPLTTALNVFLLSLGIAVITLLLLFNNQLKQKINESTKGIDLIIGAKGSPLQLILCNIFHIDFPTGNIKLNEAERFARHRLIKKAIPLALGDSYQNFRIVGTNREYADLYACELSNGEWWTKDLEVVAGSAVAEALKLKIGDTFASSHGLSKEGSLHEEVKYVVKGILKPKNNVVDRLLLTNVGSVWKVHEAHDQENDHIGNASDVINPSPLVSTIARGDSTKEITSLLIQYRNPLAAVQLPRLVNSESNMQAASPAFEIARLFSILGVGVDVLMGFAYVLIFISGLSIFIALYNSLKERQYDLAIMRSMGASRSKLFISILLEGTMLTLIGSVIGILIGHGTLLGFTQLIEESQSTGISAFIFYREELFIIAGSVGLGILCTLIPAWQAYRTDIHQVLAGS
jgi:putative ABC transport system permease protein